MRLAMLLNFTILLSSLIPRISYSEATVNKNSELQNSKFHYTETEIRTAYEGLVARGYPVTYNGVAQYMNNRPYSGEEYLEFLGDHSVNIAAYSTEMLDKAGIYNPEIFVFMDYAITATRTWGKICQSQPDYQEAWTIARDKLPEIGLQIICLAGTGGWCIFSQAYSGISTAVDLFSSWWISTQNKAGINNQLAYYKIYREYWNIQEPYQDLEVAATLDGGYLRPPAGFQYYEIAVPYDTDVFSPDTLEVIAEENYRFESSESEIDTAISLAARTAQAYLDSIVVQLAPYQSGSLTVVVDAEDNSAYIGNIGPLPVQNLFLRDKRLLPDATTDTIIEFAAGQRTILALPSGSQFSDMDEIEFQLFGVTVKIPISASIKPFVGSFSIHNNDDGFNLFAPQSIYVQSQLIPLGPNYTYDVDFGDGSPIVSGSANSTGLVFSDPHTYSQPGTYAVRLSVYDNAGHTAIMRQYYYLINKSSPVTRSFSAR